MQWLECTLTGIDGLGMNQWTCNDVPDGVERIVTNPLARREEGISRNVDNITIFVSEQLKEAAHRNYLTCVDSHPGAVFEAEILEIFGYQHLVGLFSFSIVVAVFSLMCPSN